MTRPPGMKRAAFGACVALLPVLILGHVRFYSSASRLPEVGRQRVQVPGLAAPVEVVVDRLGAGHVRAANDDDLWFTQGYLHARERFFQMDLARRTANGRMAELFGETALGGDRAMRTLRLASLAGRHAAALSDSARRALEQYAAGVNAAIAAYGLWISSDVWALGIEPAPWQVEDSLAVALLVHLTGSPAMAAELDRSIVLARLGERRAVELWGWDEGDAAHWIPPGELPATPRDADEVVSTATAPATANAWVVPPALAARGKPLLATDLHQPVAVPGYYFLIHLTSPGIDVAGASLPGLPGVLVGHTAGVAWALSPTLADDQDLYLLTLDDRRNDELVDGVWRPLRTLTEPIAIRWRAAPELLKVRLSERGPVIRDSGGEALALAWTGTYSPPLVEPLVAMAACRTVDQVAAAWQGVSGPSYELLAADTSGATLHTVVGLVPDRGRGAGRLPAPAAESLWAWRGLRAPPTGATTSTVPLSTANHDPWAEGDVPASARVPGEYQTPWRIRRIRAVLAGAHGWGLDDCAALQGDVLSLQAVALLRALWPELDRLGGPTAAALRAWDGRFAADARAATLYARLVAELAEQVGGDEAQREGLRGTVFGPDELLRLLAGGLDEGWWDDLHTEAVEGRTEMVARALAQVDAAMPAAPWGEVHALRYDHSLATFQALGPFFRLGASLPAVAAHGADDTVFRTPTEAADDLAAAAAPALVFLTEVGSWDTTRMAALPGQSGRMWSPHYADQLGIARQHVVPVFPFSPAAVDAAASARLELVP